MGSSSVTPLHHCIPCLVIPKLARRKEDESCVVFKVVHPHAEDIHHVSKLKIKLRWAESIQSFPPPCNDKYVCN